MKRLSIKSICITLVLTTMIAVISVMSTSLSALAMEPFSPNEESQEEFIDYMHKNKDKIEIKVIGDMPVKNNIDYTYIDEDSEKASVKSVNSEKDASMQISEDETLVTESFQIDNIKRVENITDVKAKTSKEQTKAYIISDEKIQEFLSAENMDDINNLLSKGYSLYFITDSNYEIDLINHKFGLLDYFPKEENYEIGTEYSQKVLEDYTEGEELPEINSYTIGCYISRNMAGEYFFGTLMSSIEKEDIYDSIVMHAVLRRKNYTSYKDINNVKAQNIAFSITADAATEDERSNFRNWDIAAYGRESWFQAYGERISVSSLMKIDDIHIGNITTYDTYGYSIDSQNLALYINVIRIGVVPYNGVTTKSVYWENISNQSNINLYDFGPQYQPKTSTLTLGFNSGFDVKAGFNGDNSVGGSIGFSASYSIPFEEVEVTNPHADPQNRTATADFKYDSGEARKQYSENTAFSVFRATDSSNTEFRPQQKVVIQFNPAFSFLIITEVDEHYQYPISRTITPNSLCF